MYYHTAINRLKNEFRIDLDNPKTTENVVRDLLWNNPRITRVVKNQLLWAFRRYREERGLPIC